jgi:hypothetical protein
MAEGNNNRILSPQEVVDAINGFNVLQLGGSESGIPKGTSFMAKILGPVVEEYVEKLDKTKYNIPVEYRPEGYEAMEFTVNVSEGAIKRLKEKHGEEYIDKMAYFAKNNWKGRVVHHVNPLNGQQRQKVELKPKGELKAKQEEIAESVEQVSKASEGNAQSESNEVRRTNEQAAEGIGDALGETIKQKIRDNLSEYEHPADIKAWADGAKDQYDVFKANFPTVKEFQEYVLGPACDTDYFKGLDDGNATIAKVYYRIRYDNEEE